MAPRALRYEDARCHAPARVRPAATRAQDPTRTHGAQR
ncbi:hypothetical protein SCATT_45600 [Streptantibioticus cattleyicolor NRRL 8057 = DSM 46488]|uniref:Uncharacterized protein n=1 Tax=Streptantibioticus cattleyicolor (strain ATCC 35852 / DSM 46488 / JCM 4925 / NBRC 14057 / NRRL 8057) TaxID=1003195 RepID=G8X0L6_STREN|nr:hypothetical protein SCATT_45600 [Streptantibioticus cattleyicolor NRRL 8057 = DSM 46488]